MQRVETMGASNTYGIVGGGTPGPDGLGRGIAYKDVLRELLGPTWEVVVAGVCGTGGIDWPPRSPFLSEYTDWLRSWKCIGDNWLLDYPEFPLLYGEAGPDEKTRGIVHPWRHLVVPHLPCDVAILMAAVGDAIRGWPVSGGTPTPAPAYGAAMLETCEALLAAGVGSVILPVDTPIVGWSEDPGHPWSQRILAYELEIQNIWAMAVPGIVPGPNLLRDLTTPGWGYFDGATDYVHPNESGHARIAELYNDVIQAL